MYLNEVILNSSSIRVKCSALWLVCGEQRKMVSVYPRDGLCQHRTPSPCQLDRRAAKDCSSGLVHSLTWVLSGPRSFLQTARSRKLSGLKPWRVSSACEPVRFVQLPREPWQVALLMLGRPLTWKRKPHGQPSLDCTRREWSPFPTCSRTLPNPVCFSEGSEGPGTPAGWTQPCGTGKEKDQSPLQEQSQGVFQQRAPKHLYHTVNLAQTEVIQVPQKFFKAHFKKEILGCN